ncbi:MAG: hypothetical protein H6939_12720 [Burkholderiales bacterium]|nr:hypothetical protein [Burkholderiales bacterium]
MLRKRSQKINKDHVDRIFGLEIDRKTNVLSLAAFLLSVLGVGGQIYFFLRGPIVSLQPIEQITFYSSRYANDIKYLKLAANMVYVNTGFPGYNDAIKKETAVLHLSGKSYTFTWKKYIHSDSKGSEFIENVVSDAHPVVINAGSVETHETSFSSLSSANNYGNFIEFNLFQQIAVAENEMLVVINYETFSGKKDFVTCTVSIDDSFRAYIKHEWISPRCAE